MILRKINVDGKIMYEQIDFQDAIVMKDTEFEFTDENEKDDFEDAVESLGELREKVDELMGILEEMDGNDKLSIQTRLEEIKNALYMSIEEHELDLYEDELDEIEDQIDELKDDSDDDDDDDDDNHNRRFKFEFKGENINLGKDFGNVFGETFGNMFDQNKNSKSNKLIMALPFLDKEDIHEIVEKILANTEEYKDLNLIAVFPFLHKNDCDKLFMRFVLDGDNEKYPIVSLAPFVSKECLSKFVDEYVNGNFQEVEINLLYPFLDTKDVKRVFKYVLTKNE